MIRDNQPVGAHTMTSSIQRLKDEELVKLSREGQSDAMASLISRYLPIIRYKASGLFGPGLEQDDLIQEGLIGLLKAIRGYDENREASFVTFANLCIMGRMQSAVRAALSPKHSPLRDYMSISPQEGEPKLSIPAQDSPESYIIGKEDTEALRRKLETLLSLFEQDTLRLYFQGHSYREISNLLHSSPKAVDNALQRVRRKLRSV